MTEGLKIKADKTAMPFMFTVDADASLLSQIGRLHHKVELNEQRQKEQEQYDDETLKKQIVFLDYEWGNIQAEVASHEDEIRTRRRDLKILRERMKVCPEESSEIKEKFKEHRKAIKDLQYFIARKKRDATAISRLIGDMVDKLSDALTDTPLPSDMDQLPLNCWFGDIEAPPSGEKHNPLPDFFKVKQKQGEIADRIYKTVDEALDTIQCVGSIYGLRHLLCECELMREGCNDKKFALWLVQNFEGKKVLVDKCANRSPEEAAKNIAKAISRERKRIENDDKLRGNIKLLANRNRPKGFAPQSCEDYKELCKQIAPKLAGIQRSISKEAGK